MARLHRHRWLGQTVVLVVVVIGICRIGRADFTRIEFTVDPELSVIELEAMVDLTSLGLGVLWLDPQGTLTDHVPQLESGFSDGSRAQYEGTILVDVDPVTRQLAFPGGGNIYGLPSGLWAPEVGGGPGGETLETLRVDPAVYGFAAGTVLWAALHDLSLDVLTGASMGQYSPDGFFDPFGTLEMTAGTLDVTDALMSSVISPVSYDLTGEPFWLDDPGSGPGYFNLSPNGQAELHLPIVISHSTTVGGEPARLYLQGQLVATGLASSVVPEPSGGALAAGGALALLAAARRRRAYQRRSI